MDHCFSPVQSHPPPPYKSESSNDPSTDNRHCTQRTLQTPAESSIESALSTEWQVTDQGKQEELAQMLATNKMRSQRQIHNNFRS